MREPLGTHDLICCHTASDYGLGMDARVIGYRMHSEISEHERHYGLSMDVLVTVRSGNTNVIMV